MPIPVVFITGLGVSLVTMLVLTTVLMLWAAAAAAVDAAIRGKTWPTYSRVQSFPLLPDVMIRHRSQWTSPGRAHLGAWMRSCCSRRAWCGGCLRSPAPGICCSSRPSACKKRSVLDPAQPIWLGGGYRKKRRHTRQHAHAAPLTYTQLLQL